MSGRGMAMYWAQTTITFRVVVDKIVPVEPSSITAPKGESNG
jgi:hypothetical protein